MVPKITNLCAVIFYDITIQKCRPDKVPIFTVEALVMELALDIITENEPDWYIIFSESLSVVNSLKNKIWPIP